MSDKKLFILDAFALIFRSHYAFAQRPLLNSKGQNVSAITGFMNSLWELIIKEKATHIAVCFDLPGGTFRNEMYTAYKANRDETPEDIIFATPWIKELVQAMNLPILALPGYEADDVAGAISRQADAEGFEVFLFTPDKDYGQLVTKNVKMMKPARSGNDVEVLDVARICEVWGIKRVEQVIDCLGLQGDAVDNIPGVPGIGPKTAQKLLEEWDSIENLIANVDNLKAGKIQDSIRMYADQAILSKELATINCDLPVKFNADDCEVGDFDYDRLTEICQDLEFRSLAKRFDDYRRKRNGIAPEPTESKQAAAKIKPAIAGQFDLFGGTGDAQSNSGTQETSIHAANNITNTAHKYHLAQSQIELNNLIDLLSKNTIICFDTETTGIDANEAELVGMSFAVQPHEAYYVPIPADAALAQAIINQFKPIFEDENIAKIGQNLKYDMLMLKWCGVEVRGTLWDTMILHYLLEPDLRHNMNYLSETYLKYQPVSIETLIGARGVKQGTMRDVPIEKIVDYAAEDADVTLQLFHYLLPKIQELDLETLYLSTEAPLITVLTAMEYEGIKVDDAFLKNYSNELTEIILRYREEIYAAVGGFEFNIDSPKQVGEILFDRMKIPYKGKKTKVGHYSTDEEKLSELAYEHEVARKILDYRSLQKLKSTYIDALPKQINPRTGRIHTSYNQALAATGRLSSQNPNLQNIPIRTPEGREIRRAFVARNSTDYTLLSADYSQIELRLIAELSNDSSMLEAFQQGLDIHQATAAKVYDVPLADVTSDQRRNAKTVNFAIVYGAGASNISQQLSISRNEAKSLIDNYFKTYSGLKGYMDSNIQAARDNGYVVTMLGRRRTLRDINSQSGMTRAGAERTAINSPVQGSAADLIKVAMIKIHNEFTSRKLKSKMLLQVHDELIFDVHNDEKEAVEKIVSDGMRFAIEGLKVPIEVGMGFGENWLEAH